MRARDRHCRFPGCQMPAARCQLDHIVPFDHDNPIAGGWTIVSNLQCAGAFHHQLYPHRLWAALALPGGAIRWISSYGTTHHTLPTRRDPKVMIAVEPRHTPARTSVPAESIAAMVRLLGSMAPV